MEEKREKNYRLINMEDVEAREIGRASCRERV